MKKQFLILFAMISASLFAQNKSYLEANIDLSAPQTKAYFYNNADHSINNVQINDQGWLLNNYGVNFSYNYLILKQLSLGTLTGIYSDTKQNFSHLRLGGLIRYFYIKNKNYNFNLKLGENISFDKKKFNKGVNIKIGFGIPVYKINGKEQILLDLFWEQNYYELDDANKLLGLSDEIPRTLIVHSYGLSLNFMFH